MLLSTSEQVRPPMLLEASVKRMNLDIVVSVGCVVTCLPT